MNEPHDIPDISIWAATVQTAVTAIQKAGATTQMILLPGKGLHRCPDLHQQRLRWELKHSAQSRWIKYQLEYLMFTSSSMWMEVALTLIARRIILKTRSCRLRLLEGEWKDGDFE
jgi:hypothetical protein